MVAIGAAQRLSSNTSMRDSNYRNAPLDFVGGRRELRRCPKTLRELAKRDGISAPARRWKFTAERDSLAEGTGFEPVWGFSCQVVFWFVGGSLFGAGKPFFVL
jgi:hypothetical protein